MEQLNELKNLVMQSLEKNGYLSNIRAQIRSSVFKTIDSQESSNKKASPFFTENLKVQRLVETEEGKLNVQLIQQCLQFYDMEHSLKIYQSEANLKTEVNRKALQETMKIKAQKEEPLLLGILQKFMKNNKKAGAGKMEKATEMPVQMKEDVSEGQMQIEEDIMRNQSKKFGESEEFGQSQGYDKTVDSLELEEYDYYEKIQ